MDWWTSLDIARQVFFLIAVIGTFVVGVQLVLQLVGFAGADMHMGDLGSGDAADHSAGVGFISLRTVTAFAAGFGWTGYAALGLGAPLWLAMAIALAVGVVLMMTLVWMMRGMLRLNSSGTLNYANAIGAVGTVYVTIPANRAGFGQVEIQVQGRLCTVQAGTRATAPLAPGTPVKAVELLEKTILLVEPLS
jgi:membrane protein implicated in regulation of membrane protease activity